MLFPANRDLTFFTKLNVTEVTYVTTTQSYGSKDQTRQQMFMTSYDRLQVKPTLVNINEAETLLAWLQNYCSGRPQVILYLGDIYLIHEMTVTAFIEDLAFLPQLEVWWRGHLSCGEFGPFSSTGYYYLDKSKLHTVPHLNAQTEDIYVHPAPFQAMQRTGLIHDSYLGAMVYFCAKQYESLPAYLERKTLMCGWLGTDWLSYRTYLMQKAVLINGTYSQLLSNCLPVRNDFLRHLGVKLETTNDSRFIQIVLNRAWSTEQKLVSVVVTSRNETFFSWENIRSTLPSTFANWIRNPFSSSLSLLQDHMGKVTWC